MKRKTAKEILADSFLELAGTKNVDKITVREIVDNCGYSTATFYRQFKDKYDLIAWEAATRTAEIKDKVGTGSYVWRDTLLDGARFYHSRKEYLANLLMHTSGYDSYIRYKTELNYNALKSYVQKTYGKSRLMNKQTCTFGFM